MISAKFSVPALVQITSFAIILVWFLIEVVSKIALCRSISTLTNFLYGSSICLKSCVYDLLQLTLGFSCMFQLLPLDGAAA